jgi:hypothetical protein
MENRDAADAMERMGLRYEQNHGVMIADLMILAKDYRGDSQTAAKLREMPVREARILAEMIDDHAKLDDKTLDEVFMKINTSELAEQFAVHIDKQISGLKAKALSRAQSSQLYTAAAGFNVLSFLVDSFTESDLERLTNIIKKHPHADNKELQNYMARCLRKAAAASTQHKKSILEFTADIKRNRKSLLLLAEETEPFIRYMK